MICYSNNCGFAWYNIASIKILFGILLFIDRVVGHIPQVSKSCRIRNSTCTNIFTVRPQRRDVYIKADTLSTSCR